METTAAYLPMDRRQALARGENLPEQTKGAVLFADISGFTPLTEGLVQALGRRRGVEELTAQLNHVYDALIAQVHRYRGSVIGFVGDAITCWFDGDDGRYATACALEMQREMEQFTAVPTPVGTTVALSIKTAVTVGPAHRLQVGHQSIRLIEVLAGTILERVSLAEKIAQSGEVVVGAEVMGRIGSLAVVTEWRPAANGENFAVLTGLSQTIDPNPWPETQPIPVEVTQDWLHTPIYQKLQRGEADFLAEIRPVVALFLRFGGIDYDEDEQASLKLNAYIRWVERVLARYGGTLIQLTIGDKGSFLYAAFGAPLTYDDNPARAVAAALDLRTAPSSLPSIGAVQIGITQGQMRVGAYGSKSRRTYGVIGNEVNIAARLMALAEPGQILISSRIAKAVDQSYDCQSLGPVLLKGLAEPMTAYGVNGRRIKSKSEPAIGPALTPLVGRLPERVILAIHLQKLLDGDKSTLLIEGEAGIGKSRLVEELLAQAGNLGIPIFIGAGEAVEQATTFFAWRSIFQELLDVDETTDMAVAQQQIMACVGDNLYWQERLPLLNAILPFNWPDNELTAQMTGEVRASNTRDLLVHLLANIPRVMSAFLLVLEDAHWLDSASWGLLSQIQRQAPNLLLVVVTRPFVGEEIQGNTPKEYQQLRADSHTQCLQLTSLSAEDSLDLVCRRLSVKSLPQPIIALIQERAEGNPFFSEEIAYSLRDAGYLSIHDGQAEMTVTADRLNQLDFPHTIQEVITSRIDRLSPSQQLALKVASVIGRLFPYQLLHAIHPVAADKPHLENILTILVQRDITSVETPQPNLAYSFKHIITQEVAYHLLLYVQRQQLHRAVAEWLETAHTADLASYYTTLAHHWRQTVDQQTTDRLLLTKAVEYLEKSGIQALQNGAYVEAVRYLEQTIDLAEGHAVLLQIDDLKRMTWQRRLGEAYFGLGQVSTSRSHFHQALAYSGHPFPVNINRGLLSQLLRLTWHRFPRKWLKAWLSSPMFGSAEQLSGAVAVYNQLTISFYLTNEYLEMIYSGWDAIILGERIDASPELALTYANMTNFYVFFRLHGLAQSYAVQAQTLAQQSPNLLTKAQVLQSKSVQQLGYVTWTDLQAKIEEAISIYEHVGHRRGAGDMMGLLGYCYYYRGCFEKGRQMGEAMYEVAVSANNLEQHGWAAFGQGLHLLRLGCMDEAESKFQQALDHLRSAPSPVVESACLGQLAKIYTYQDRSEFARQMSEQATHKPDQLLPFNFMLLNSFEPVAYVYLALWQQDLTNKTAQKQARQACRRLRRFAFFHPIGRPFAYLYWGRYQWQAGRHWLARRTWAKSLKIAQQLDMPYEEGLAHYEIGRQTPLGNPLRPKHLAQAIEIFTRLNAAHDLKLAQTELDLT